jgi:hypothetical protein
VIHTNAKSGSPVLTALLAHTHFRSAPSGNSVAPQALAAVRTTDSREATNDDAPEKWYQIHNPLWVIVIGKAFLFSVMAIVVALS